MYFHENKEKRMNVQRSKSNAQEGYQRAMSDFGLKRTEHHFRAPVLLLKSQENGR